jgi:hypothetical protein
VTDSRRLDITRLFATEDEALRAADARAIIAAARADGVAIDDGNVVDLLLDNLPGAPSIEDCRAALRDAGLAAEFPGAASGRGRAASPQESP